MRPFFVLILGVALFGCSPAASNPTTTIAVTTSTAPTTTTTTLAAADARTAFVSCLADRDVGVPAELFDPDGALRLEELAESLDTSNPDVQTAITGCAGLLSSTQLVDLGADPEVRLLVIEQLAAFTRCMRDQGVADFPDPQVGESLNLPYPPEEIPFSAPGFDEAMSTCQNVVGAFGLGDR